MILAVQPTQPFINSEHNQRSYLLFVQLSKALWLICCDAYVIDYIFISARSLGLIRKSLISLSF